MDTRTDTIQGWLPRLVSEVLAVDADLIDVDTRLHRYGLTSLNAAELTSRISARIECPLSPTLVWDHPTLRRLAAFLAGGQDDTGHRPPVAMAADDIIAITGLACRFPGAEDPEAFWRMMCDGTDAVTEVPARRWSIDALYDPDPLAPGRVATKWGGFIENVDRFDAGFFGLSPTEAAHADPQQRLALELAWEAVEDAGLRASRLGGSRTGVFVGAMWNDYARLMSGPDAIAPHTATGQDISIISARIAYVLGLEGPALTVDTACSSALVAVHLACRSLRAGETTRAIAGGVHLTLAPESGIAMTKFGAMAPDGRCRAFDAGASGYVRGEGGGLVVLQPLSAALAEGARVYAVIRGSAMNNDGPSNGLTAPNPAAQRMMLRDALHDAKVDAADIDYVEAHGTGTRLGDPIEARALSSVLCVGRIEPLRIGSVKTNIGHLEAAAGAAGLIKLALSLYHRWIPPSLHFNRPNPAIDFSDLRLSVQSSGGAWPQSPHLPTGGVSSFGFGGTNCHAILQAPERARVAPVFVFAGNGGNWPGMATELLAEPVFHASLVRSGDTLRALGYGADVTGILTAPPPDARLADVALGQPALCAFQLALTDLLLSKGIRPAAVIGHSVGEAAAAACAGILSAADALRIVVARSRLQATTSGRGAMAMVLAPAAAAEPLLGPDVVVAGENGPTATLISGAPDAVEATCRRLEAAGIDSLRIDVPVAYHSPQMEPLCEPLAASLHGLQAGTATTPMVSTVTGTWVGEHSLDAQYWTRNMRAPVAFRRGIATLAEAGFAAFLEIAPRPLLAAQIGQTVPPARVVSPSWRKGAQALSELTAVFGESDQPLAPRVGQRPRHLLILSARSQPALDVMAQRWASRVAENFPDLCHTALVGRERFAYRLALHAASGEEAARRLAAGDFVRGVAQIGAATSFDQTRGTEESWHTCLDRCEAAFVAGADIDGALFDTGEPWRVVAAPTYPFERERHWLPKSADTLSYELQWQPYAIPPFATAWPDVAIEPQASDPDLDASASLFAHAALARVPLAEVVPRHRAFAERLAGWGAVAGEAVPSEQLGDSVASRLVRRVGDALPDILSGRVDPLEILFPGGDMRDAAALYAEAPFAAAQRVLGAVIGQLAPRRVLEVGGGTGALTAHVLPHLPQGGVYVFSDVSPVFLTAASARFATFAGLRTAILDVDRPAGLDETFDAVVAANTLHAGVDIGQVLTGLLARLEPCGVLGLVELVRAPRWIDLVFGVTEGWWRFVGDPLRPGHALMDAGGWRAVLEQQGFTDILIRDDGDAHAVILARAPARNWRMAGIAAPVDLPTAEAADMLYCPGDASPDVLVEEVEHLVSAGRRVSVLLDTSVAHAAVCGAARAISLTRSSAVGTVFHLGDREAGTLAALDALLRAGVGHEDEIRLDAGGATVARLARVTSDGVPVGIRADRLYVIAGGLGRLGRSFARFLVKHGARDLLLIGRGAAAEGAPGFGPGVRVRVLRLDLTAPDAAGHLVSAIDRPLGGLVHAAGLADGPTRAVMAGKLGIARALAEAAAAACGRDRVERPDFLLLFSSAAGVWGAADRVAYSAANRAMDRWAETMRETGLPVTSIAFGRFSEKGLLTPSEDAALDRAGLLAMDPDEAFGAAMLAVADRVVLRVVARVDWPRFAAAYGARRRRRLFDHLVPAEVPRPTAPAGPAQPAGRLDVASIVAGLLGHGDTKAVDPDRGLFEQGLDSLLAVSLRRRLEAEAEVAVPATVLFSHPTINRLVEWLSGQRAVPAAVPTRARGDAIAIIGVGCRFPASDGPDAFLSRLMAGYDAVGPRPAERSFPGVVPDDAVLRRGGFLDGIDLFDAGFFGISPREAAQMDPQQRLLLEVSWQALEHACVAPDRLAGSRAGVFIGATGSDYAALARAAGLDGLDAHSLTGQPSNTLAGRIAFQLGLRGPALTLDTACSSSLVAVHLAVRALRDGEADLALAGGVNLVLTPDTSMMLSRAGLLSARGRCATFDAMADGYVRGEGCGVVVLKPLTRAIADGDRVLAVIRGSAMNHDGRSSSFTAPNGAAQTEVIAAALADAGLAPTEIDFVEAHGTGTQLGDAVELDALDAAFSGRGRPLPVGSLKANFGHMEAAAGVAGLIKATLALEAAVLPPQIHFTTPNPHAAARGIEIPTTARPLPGSVRRACVSAFGASGTNAHVVLESCDTPPEPRGEGGSVLLLSAATRASLEALRDRLAATLATGRANFADVCHSFAVGRARLGWWLTAASPAELPAAPIHHGKIPEWADIVPRGRRVVVPGTILDRKRHWLAAAPVALLSTPRRSARSGEEVREGRLTQEIPWLRDHVVDGAVLLPAVGFIALARSTGAQRLETVTFPRRLVVPAEGAAVQLVRTRDGEISLHVLEAGEWVLTASALVAAGDGIAALDGCPAAGADVLDGGAFAAELARRGFAFGPSYHLVQRVTRDGGVAVLDLLESGDALDPARLDCALQALTALLPDDPGSVWLPAGIDRVTIAAEPFGIARARARLRDLEDRSALGDVVLERADGTCLARFDGVSMRRVDRAAPSLIHDVVWRPAATAAPARPGRWHAIGPDASRLGVSSHDEQGAAKLPAVDGVIDLRPLSARTPADCIAETSDLVRRMAALPDPPQLVLVSRAAASAPLTAIGPVPAAAVLMGLQPVIEAEHPALRCRWLDLDSVEATLPEGWAGPAGRCAYRAGQWLSPVVEPGLHMEGVALEAGREASFAGLTFSRHVATPPGDGEVQVGVAAAGLNFRDVLTVLGRAPPPVWRLGLECAGVVLAVGSSVSDLKVGDPVIAFGPGCLAATVTLPATRVVRRPDWLDEDIAVTLPVACLTAWHGLHDIARVGAGMRVLIHAAAGGVGGAMARLARLAGARVFGTASAGKLAAALANGAEAVGDSRSTGFVATAREWAGGEGFDIVVNALGPDMTDASAALLRPGGLFLEIGQAPRPARTDIRHCAYDLVAPMAEPGWFADRMGQSLDFLRSGRLEPPARIVLPVSRAVEAFQSLGQGRTVGKVVLRFPRRISVHGTILVTGGTGAVGRALAAKLVELGADRVVLAARRPVPADPRFETEIVDVTDRVALAALLARLPDLRGVVHAAGIVRDGLLDDIEREDIAAVLAPKILGAENLDALTRDRALDIFVLVSSSAGVLGSAGQAAYAGANAWLDRLAAMRRAAGLPATSIGFGPWDIGMFAVLDQPHQARLQREGYRPMPAHAAAEAFAEALGRGAVHQLVMDRSGSGRPVDVPAVLAPVVARPLDRDTLAVALAERLRALLGLPKGARLLADQPLRDLGLDSLLAVSLRHELAAAYSLDLPTTLLFDRPTLAALTEHLWHLLAPDTPSQGEEAFGDLDADQLAALLASELEVAR